MRTGFLKIKETLTKTIAAPGVLRKIVGLLIGIFVLSAVLWVLDKLVIYYFPRSYVDELTYAVGITSILLALYCG